MAKAVNILPPLTAPTLVLSREAASGDYVAGTYTFGIFVSGVDQNEGLSMWNSPCVEDTIVLEDGDAVRYTWSNLDVNTTRVFAFQKLFNRYYSLTGDDGYDYKGIIENDFEGWGINRI